MMNKKTKHHRRYVVEAGVGEVGIPPRLLSCPATLTMSRRLSHDKWVGKQAVEAVII
jgi:hypothetical protein